MTTTPTIHGPMPVSLEGRQGLRYWVHHPGILTGDPSADEQFAGYPLFVFLPEGRPPHETPLVIALQGIAAPLQWNSFLVPTLLDMGIACALLDTPMAGERSLVRTCSGEIIDEIVPLVRSRVSLDTGIMPRLMDLTARDLATVRQLLAERHGLHDSRVALFGVSLGALLCSFTFLRDGLGSRLLCAIGHADLPAFARSYAPSLTPLLASAPMRALGQLAARVRVPRLAAVTEFLALLNALKTETPHVRAANPLTYLNGSLVGRPARFLVGALDNLVRAEDAARVARQFPDGACYVVPGLGHGGDDFPNHARYFVMTQLGDWRL